MDPTDELRFKIAAARRMLAREGCDSKIAGQVSARQPGTDNFWVNGFEYFDETLPDTLFQVDQRLELVEGEGHPTPALGFHAAFYAARPDVNAIVHLHSHWLSVFATTRRLIGMYNVVSVLFYDDQALYEDDGTRPAVEGPRMVAALGDKRVLLIKNHGAVVASQSLEAATIEAMALEQAARYHIEAEMVGGTEFPPAESLRGRVGYQRHYIPEMWQANMRRLRISDPDLFEWASRSAGRSG